MRLYSTICLFALVLLSNIGCSSMKPTVKGWNPLKAIARDKDSQFESDPASMAVIWKDSVYEKPGVPSVKGFGGRVFIYNSDNEPIKAEGELIVYGYDESNVAHTDQNHAGADKKFVFPKEKFQQHFSQSDLGPSYSVWIPWEKIGGIRKSITLIPVFKTNTGNVLRSGHSINVLPGRKPDADGMQAENKDNSRNVIAQASFHNQSDADKNTNIAQASGSTTIEKPRLRTTTLNLPPSLAKKLAQTSASAKPLTKEAAQQDKKVRTVADKSDSTETREPIGKRKEQPKATTARIFGVPGSF